MGKFPFIVDGRSVSFVTDRLGLGNRLIPMGCVLSLAAELNYNPIMFWTSDEIIGGANFGDLFESSNLPFKLIEGREARIMRAILFMNSSRLPPPKRISKQLRRLVLLQYGKRIELPNGKLQAEFRDLVATDLLSFRKIAFSTFGLFRYGCDLNWLKPVPQIARRVAELKQQFAPNTVGIHIRGTDSPYYPPVEKMITRMLTEVELDPNVKFFIASDGDEAEKQIFEVFGEKLIKINQSPRTTFNGQQDAVVDLFGLASTSRIIGAKYSSFPLLASLVGNTPFLNMKNPSPRSHRM